MPRVYPLFSSSKGNSVFVGTPESGILIDCGVSFAKLREAFSVNNLSFSAVKGIFITHEHSDHTGGLKMLTKKTGIPVYSGSITLDILYDRGQICSSSRDITDYTELDGMKITRFATSHDTKESCGYTVEFPDGEKFALCTDLGYVSDEVRTAVMGSNAVVIEANYDEQMLRRGNYPAYLKQRIRSDVGHLSNEDSGKFISQLVAAGTSRIILGHLSQENNTPDTAVSTVESILAENGFSAIKDYLLYCAPVKSEGMFVAF